MQATLDADDIWTEIELGIHRGVLGFVEDSLGKVVDMFGSHQVYAADGIIRVKFVWLLVACEAAKYYV